MLGSKDPDQIVIGNVVITGKFNLKELNMDEIVWRLRGSYNPSMFAAVQLRSTRPSSTALCFKSGQIVCTGSASESAAYLSIMYFTRLIRITVHPDIRLTDMKIRLLVAKSHCGSPVRLNNLNRAYALHSMCEATGFPSLRLKIGTSKVKVLVFAMGAIVLTGGTTREQIKQVWAQALAIIKPYLTPTAAKYSDLRYDMEAEESEDEGLNNDDLHKLLKTCNLFQ
jgi:TATA-box binding protein (TBP) (component of TFIID and TFIIIB)